MDTGPKPEDILNKYAQALGRDYQAYTNHVQRVIRFCFLLEKDLDPAQREQIVIAACFHDLGIWTADTFDYLQPSILLATSYLTRMHHDSWIDQTELMIGMHHKIRRYENKRYPLVEIFRRADWIDVSLGLLTFGLDPQEISRIRALFPNSGFHQRLFLLGLRELRRNPLSPLPMMRW